MSYNVFHDEASWYLNMVMVDDSLQYLENLEVGKKKVLLSGIVESTEVTYVREKRYCVNSLVRALSIMLSHNQLTIV